MYRANTATALSKVNYIPVPISTLKTKGLFGRLKTSPLTLFQHFSFDINTNLYATADTAVHINAATT
jgi:hypothetical protein